MPPVAPFLGSARAARVHLVCTCVRVYVYVYVRSCARARTYAQCPCCLRALSAERRGRDHALSEEDCATIRVFLWWLISVCLAVRVCRRSCSVHTAPRVLSVPSLARLASPRWPCVWFELRRLHRLACAHAFVRALSAARCTSCFARRASPLLTVETSVSPCQCV
eukprot:EC815637.1.p3 GENE.EC815637.1~~EC815637.1.p3  ORF type:complete len:165 (+),score=26.77 EC815637.1:123-617(+)